MWRYENSKKKPLQVDNTSAKVNDPQTWNTFENCLTALNEGRVFSGIGFVLDETDDIIGWDLDHCLDVKNLTVLPWAQRIIDALGGYTEITPSGSGFRVFVRGSIDTVGSGGKGKSNKNIECYHDRRFLTITGNRWPGTSESLGIQDDALWRSIFTEESKEVKKAKKDAKFKRLWDGDWKTDRYASQSEADLALCRMLVHRLSGDVARVDGEFRKSGLYRPKWDVDHHGGKGTYGQWTLAQAILGYKENVHLTDSGNARRFVSLHRENARFSKMGWLIWDDSRFAVDELQRVFLLAGEVSKQIETEAEGVKDDDEMRDTLVSWSRKCESVSTIRNLIALAGAQPEIAVRVEDLDSKPHLVNLMNGTLDTMTGNLRDHDRKDLLTKVVPLRYDPSAVAPAWEQFLVDVMDGDIEMVSYLQRMVGYSLTGVVDEQVFFLLYGIGRNGKSTFYKTILKMMGEYAKTFSKEIILKSKHDAFIQYERLFADLFGARLAVVPEWGVNESLNEDVIKRVTGDDNMRGRRLYQESVEFESTAKLWIIGNHKPSIRGTDLGMWRRVQMIPFSVIIPETKQDKKLKYKLLEELPGILKWAITGLGEWRRIGLCPPARVLAATEEYRANQDVFGQFLDEQCALESNAQVYHHELYARYVEMMEQNREFVVKSREFIERMRDHGFSDAPGTGNKKKWLGLFLKNTQQRMEDM